MTPVDQRITACPRRGDGADPAGVPGDCLRAAVASLLELPYDQVPHFALHGPGWWDHLRRWARSRGADFARVPPHAIRHNVTGDPDALLIARGPSLRGARGGHVVIADLNLRTVWDPHPSRAGLLSVDEVFVVAAPYWPEPAQRALCAAPARVGAPTPRRGRLPSTA